MGRSRGGSTAYRSTLFARLRERDLRIGPKAKKLLFAYPTITLTPPSAALWGHDQEKTVGIEQLKALRARLYAADPRIG
jgi:hypothetical protein